MSEVVKADEIQAIEKECSPILEEAHNLVIVDEKGLEVAKNLVRNCRDLIKKVKDTFDPMKKKTKAAHSEVCNKEKEHLGAPEEAKKIAERAIGKYADLLRDQARIAEEKRIADRNKEIEKITKRLSKHLEGLGDIEAQIVDLQNKLNGDELTDIQTEVVQGQLEALERKRDTKADTVDRNQAQAEAAEVLPVNSTPAVSLKGAGGGRTERIPTVFNKEALIKAIAEGKAPIDLVDESMGKLKKYVNAFPNSRVPGININTKSVVRVS